MPLILFGARLSGMDRAFLQLDRAENSGKRVARVLAASSRQRIKAAGNSPATTGTRKERHELRTERTKLKE